MDTAILPAVAGFAVAATITPGPNNIMLMASGANYGFRRTVPHLLGITVGVSVLIILAGLGLMAALDTTPALHTALMAASIIYLLYLAWKIANAGVPQNSAANGRPFTFLQAAAFQWVNPKVWATGLSAITLYAPDTSFSSITLVAGILAAAGLSSNSLWAWIGTFVSSWLSTGTRLRVFNISMALLLIASLYPALSR